MGILFHHLLALVATRRQIKRENFHDNNDGDSTGVGDNNDGDSTGVGDNDDVGFLISAHGTKRIFEEKS